MLLDRVTISGLGLGNIPTSRGAEGVEVSMMRMPFVGVKSFVQVHVFDTMATLSKGFAGDGVFDKGADAVGVAGMADVDDHVGEGDEEAQLE